MENLRGFEVKYMSTTNTRGARIKILDLRNEKSVIIDRDYNNAHFVHDAYDFLSKNIEILGITQLCTNKYLILTRDFKTQIK